MAGKDKAGSSGAGLLTLSEVSKRTGISMPTLQRYKKEYQDRIPSEGQGRKQRYPEAALPVFEEIKKENVGRRGRPRKSEAGGKRTKKGAAKASKRKGRGAKKSSSKAKPAESAASGDLLTLTEVSKRSGLSYPTLVRYVKLHGAKIPYEGSGRRRRYHPESVEVFKELRQSSGRGGRKSTGGGRRKVAGGTGGGSGGGSGSGGAGAGLARRVAALEKEIKSLVKLIKKPLTVTVSRK